jgi:NTE family protein
LAGGDGSSIIRCKSGIEHSGARSLRPLDVGPIFKIVRSVRAFTRELFRAPTSHDECGSPARPLIGLALGGGFARGLAHIGILKVLEEHQIPVDFVAGTSVGSIIGAAFCSGISSKELEEIAGMVRFRDFARWTLSRYGLCSNDRMAAFLDRFLKAKTFEELKIPLAVAATEFATGDGIVFRSGPVVDAVRASCAYPGMFLPVNLNGRLYVDGMLAHTVPTLPLREMGAQRVLAVHLSSHWVNLSGPRHVFDVIGQCFSIAQSRMSGAWESASDLTLAPDVRGFAYDAFDRARELISAGEAAARAALPVLQQWLETAAPPGAVELSKAPALIGKPRVA